MPDRQAVQQLPVRLPLGHMLIHQFDETLYMSTVIGCLELVKQQLINEGLENDDD